MKYQILITILTVYSLFADDIRTAVFSAPIDIYFDWMSLVVMSVFTVEILLSSAFVEGYFLSFFFFLDIVSTVSIIFDINFISDIIFSTSTNSNLAHLAAQSKASRAATRAVRIVKLFRIIRIIKLYKNAQKARSIKEEARKKQILKEKLNKRKNRNRPADTLRDQLSNSLRDQASTGQQSHKVMLPSSLRNDAGSNLQQEDLVPNQIDVPAEEVLESNIDDAELEKAMKNESKIGKILSELSLKKIIIVVLIMMFVIPLFS